MPPVTQRASETGRRSLSSCSALVTWCFREAECYWPWPECKPVRVLAAANTSRTPCLLEYTAFRTPSALAGQRNGHSSTEGRTALRHSRFGNSAKSGRPHHLPDRCHSVFVESKCTKHKREHSVQPGVDADPSVGGRQTHVSLFSWGETCNLGAR